VPSVWKMDPTKSPKGPSLKLSLRNSLLLLLLTATDAVVARRTNEPSNIHEKNTYNTNLRHSNLIEQQFHRRVKNKKKDKDEYEDEIEDEIEDKDEDEYEDEDNDDCSIELTRDGMSPADVKRSSVAVKLSYLAYKLDEFPEFDEEPAYAELFYGQEERGVFYESGIDAVYTTRIRNEFCVAVFRGTEHNRDDWDSNFEIDAVEFEMENASGKDKKASTDAVCDVRSGYHDSYSNFKYRSGVESFLQTCREECPECDIVLTGHSQGGGIAEVAALYYKRLTASNPKKILRHYLWGSTCNRRRVPPDVCERRAVWVLSLHHDHGGRLRKGPHLRSDSHDHCQRAGRFRKRWHRRRRIVVRVG